MKRGDRVAVQYLDLTADFSGEPEDADLGQGTVLGFFWGYKSLCGVECLLLAIHEWKGENWQRGYHAIPRALVRKVERI